MHHRPGRLVRSKVIGLRRPQRRTQSKHLTVSAGLAQRRCKGQRAALFHSRIADGQRRLVVVYIRTSIITVAARAVIGDGALGRIRVRDVARCSIRAERQRLRTFVHIVRSGWNLDREGRHPSRQREAAICCHSNRASCMHHCPGQFVRSKVIGLRRPQRRTQSKHLTVRTGLAQRRCKGQRAALFHRRITDGQRRLVVVASTGAGAIVQNRTYALTIQNLCARGGIGQIDIKILRPFVHRVIGNRYRHLCSRLVCRKAHRSQRYVCKV